MLPRAWSERLRDILDAIAEIKTFTQGMDFDAFRNDPKTLRAVELDFIIIGEAAHHIPETVQAAHPGSLITRAGARRRGRPAGGHRQLPPGRRRRQPVVWPVLCDAIGCLSRRSDRRFTRARCNRDFAGVLIDPLQRAFGVHHRRLHRLINALGVELKGGRQAFQVRDHYAARILDLADLARMAYQVGR